MLHTSHRDFFSMVNQKISSFINRYNEKAARKSCAKLNGMTAEGCEVLVKDVRSSSASSVWCSTSQSEDNAEHLQTDHYYPAACDVGEVNKCSTKLNILPMVKAPSNRNLCLFYAIYNSLDLQQRLAFSGGNSDEVTPHKCFEDYILQTCPLKNVLLKSWIARKSKFGYNSRDMYMYLKHLKSVGAITQFQWKSVYTWAPSTCTKLAEDSIMVLFGNSPTKDSTKKSTATKYFANLQNIKRVESRYIKPLRPTALSDKLYLAWCRNFKCAYGHASAIRRGVTSELLFFDTANKIIKPFSVTTLANANVNICSVLILTLEL